MLADITPVVVRIASTSVGAVSALARLIIDTMRFFRSSSALRLGPSVFGWPLAPSRIRRSCALLTLVALIFGTPAIEAGSLLREVFSNIGGTSLSDLTNSPAYPNSPSLTNYVTDFFEAPTDVDENYGQRMHGYVIPPLDGDYTFWIASDDNGGLWLSTDEDPVKQRLIASVNSWTSSREWGKEPNQQSAPIHLEANKAYYIAALMKEGGGGDNLAVRWLRPDKMDEAPIPATYLLPWGTAFTAPLIGQQPTNTTAIEGQLATFVVKVKNAAPVTFKWRRYDTYIPNSDTATLLYGPVTLLDNGARFSVLLTNRIGFTNSTEALLTVVPDTTPPRLVSALNFGRSTVRLIFSEAVALPEATNAANYGLDHGIGVTSVSMGADARTVLLATDSLSFGTAYTLTVSKVTDRALNPNPIQPGSTLQFTAVEYAPLDIGGPALSGSSVSVPGGFDVTGGGTDIGGVSDQFHFAYQTRSGDFDVQVKVAGLSVTDPYARGGLMARETLNANARFAAVFASSLQMGCFFEARDTVGAAASLAAPPGGMPVNYPETWLRLRRLGTAFTGYASLDGQTWVQLGSRTLPGLTGVLYFGFAATGANPSVATAVQFRDIRPTVSQVTGFFTPTTEPLGPSSRATCLVFSEIMYHPRARDDQKDLAYVEIYNAGAIFEDLTHWRLSGDIDYRFPDGFKLAAGDFVVVAAAPGDLAAVCGLSNVLGPYTNSLSKSSGTLRLRNNADAIRLEVNYSSDPPWPVEADGKGHSLVLARPSYGEDDPRAWAASERIGGSPGRQETFYPVSQRNVVINEFLAHTDDPQLDYIELYNHSNSDVDLSGCWLSDDIATNKFRIPDKTTIPARGFLSFDQNQLGFSLDAAGETLFLVDSNATRVLDAIRFGGQENGVASGRSPDGSPTIRRLTSPTPGAPNAPWRIEEVVINEIMYSPISGESEDEYVELYNRSTNEVDLSDWRFTSGINFRIPNGNRLSPGGYLVVAKSVARLLANYPHLNMTNTVGDYSGTLRNSGDRITLAKPDRIISTNDLGDVVTHTIPIVVDEVSYSAGGRWGKWSDGGGSSLELIDPNADPLRPSNWADSDETGKAAWTTVSFTGTLDNGQGGFAANRLHISMQGMGECLVDDVGVFKVAGVNLLTNGGFELGVGAWKFFGNHSESTVDTTGAATGTRCLHVRGQGDGDTGVNSIRTTLAAGLASGNTATITAKVRWLAGWPEVLFRSRGAWIEMPARMEVPRNLGTPGEANSRRVNNAGPAIFDVNHSPALPRAGQPVLVTCRVSDPDNIGSLRLRWRADPSATLSNVTLRDDGASGDLVAGDGIYSALIPGRSDTVVVAFRIEATDAAATPATTIFPAGAPAQECHVRWGDPVPSGTFGHYHLWNTAATDAARNNALNNTWRDATLVYGNQRVIYNAGFRDKGSPYHAGGGDYAVTVPQDDMLFGVTDHVLASTGNGGSEETGLRGQVSAWIAQEMGISYLHSRYILVYRNGTPHQNVSEDLEQPNRQYAERWFPEVAGGDLYKVAVWFEFQDDNLNFGATSATLEKFTTTGDALKLGRYRWNYQRRSNDGTANNYTNIFDLVGAANDTSTNYVNKVLNLADIEEWMRVFAYHRVLGNWDSWSFSVGQNMFLYKQPGLRWVIMPWDIDFVLGIGNGSNDPVRFDQDPVILRMYNTPAFRRMLWRAFIDAVNGPMLPDNYRPQIDARRAMLLKNGIQGISDVGGIYTYINQRRTYLLSQIKAADAAQLAITTSGGIDFRSTTPTAILAGTAPFAVAAIEVNGVPYPVSWTDQNRFQLVVPLTQATNAFSLTGKDRLGKMVPGATDTITVTYAGAVQQPQDYVVINEIHYDPVEPRASFVELFNRSTTTPFDLSSFWMEGLGYTFTEGAIIPPNSYLILARDRGAFAAAYGAIIPVFDEFPGSLDNGGEHLALMKPGALANESILISDVRYDNRAPWPTNAAGMGPSLQLVDASRDVYRVGNWASTATNDVNRVTPGRANSVRQSLQPFPLLWINEVLPNNVTGLADPQGHRVPWIELYNAGTTAIDLAPFYLTDRFTNLTQWRFPAGATIGPKGFLVLWADGETGESTAATPHTSFRLNPSTGIVALVRTQGSADAPAVMDYLEYGQLSPDRSYGSYPDGEPRKRRFFQVATPNGGNDPTSPPIQVRINEFMAGNTKTLANPLDGGSDDWFELYNGDLLPVDLSGYYLTDTLTNITKATIPAGVIIPAGGFLLVWADQKTASYTPGDDLHVNFKLASAGEELGLFAPDHSRVDSVSFAQQTDDVSMGCYPDGGEPPMVAMVIPTPRVANLLAGGNTPPVLNAIGNKTVAEQTRLDFTARATDVDADQTLTFSLGPDAPAGASIDEQTGEFTWTPSEAQGPGNYSFAVRVTDSGVPARTASERITVTVSEVNRPPVLAAIDDQIAPEGSLLTIPIAATDPDLPAGSLVFSLDPGSPLGMEINPTNGLLTWRPSEPQGPGEYTITVQVTDSGSPALSDSKRFKVMVPEVNNPPDLAAIQPQTIDELSTMTLTVRAVDPDDPPSTIVYSFDLAPDGARVSPTTGVITWTPTEAQGPTNAIFVVRATESAPPNLSSASTFSVAVREVNQAPVLAPIPDLSVLEGDTAAFTASATDADLPAQSLRFSLDQGAPAGAVIRSDSGQFTWITAADQGGSTNRITVRVTDDGAGGLSDSRTFDVAVHPRFRVVINEIMYRPPTTNSEYIELLNASSNTTQNLSGLVLAGGDFSFTFPPGSTLAPRGLFCVVQEPAAFGGAYGTNLSIAGRWSGRLGSSNTVKLFRPGSGVEPPEIYDTVTFGDDSPWPPAANEGGASLQLIDAWRDNDRVGNWSATAVYAGPRHPVVMTNQWRYYQSGWLPGTAWTEATYDDSAWPQGRGLLYWEESALPAPKNTALTLGRMAYYFRTRFTLPSVPVGASLSLTTIIDDGAIFFLNGRELFRFNVDPGLLTTNTVANTVVGNAAVSGPVILPADALLAGENVLSVVALQQNSGSSDIVMGCSLDIEGGSMIGFTPGAPNNVATSLPEFPALRINEVAARGTPGLADVTGANDPWVELFNSGQSDVALDGLFLTDDYTRLQKWALPAGRIVPSGAYVVLFADGEPAQTTSGEMHTNFRLPSTEGVPWSVALCRVQNSQPAVVDYMAGVVGPASSTVGRLPDGLTDSVRASLAPTPGARNRVASDDRPPVLDCHFTVEGFPVVAWSSAPGWIYEVQFKNDLDESLWQSLARVTVDGDVATFTDSTVERPPKRFYRVVLRP